MTTDNSPFDPQGTLTRLGDLIAQLSGGGQAAPAAGPADDYTMWPSTADPAGYLSVFPQSNPFGKAAPARTGVSITPQPQRPPSPIQPPQQQQVAQPSMEQLITMGRAGVTWDGNQWSNAQQSAPPQNPLMQLLQQLFGLQQPQQPQQPLPSGNAIGGIRQMGGTVPNFLELLGLGAPVPQGNMGGAFQQMSGFSAPSPQSMNNMAPSEYKYLQGLVESPLVGMPFEDLLDAILAPFQGLRAGPAARSR